jgi:hypothetical protein
MIANNLGLIEMGFTFLVVVGWGFWELHQLKKGK